MKMTTLSEVISEALKHLAALRRSVDRLAAVDYHQAQAAHEVLVLADMENWVRSIGSPDGSDR